MNGLVPRLAVDRRRMESRRARRLKMAYSARAEVGTRSSPQSVRTIRTTLPVATDITVKTVNAGEIESWTRYMPSP